MDDASASTAPAGLQPRPSAAGLYRRHDLVWLAAGADVPGPWVVAATPAGLAAKGQLRLGRCLPPQGSRGDAAQLDAAQPRPTRRALDVAAWSVHQHRPPLTPDEVLRRLPQLPAPWRHTLQAVQRWAAAPALALGVYGSLAWQALLGASTGLLRADSDLDLLVEPAGLLAPDALRALLHALEALSQASVAGGGPRIDGELRLPSGDVMWREAADVLGGRAHRVLVKRHGGAELLPAAALLRWPAQAGACASLSPAGLDALACAALQAEASSWPKPGLVSPVDQGSHPDMDFRLLQAAIAALAGSFGEMARAARAGAGFAELAAIGRGAEARMYAATDGVNAYRGAIFHLGLLVAAAAVAPAGASPAAWVRESWGAALRRHQVATPSHGGAAARLQGAGGAIAEAAQGFPTVVEVVLPALRAARRRGFDPERARIAALLASVAVLEDTNLLWRGGRAGLAWARAEASACLRRDDIALRDWRARLAQLHDAFVARRLSPGGSADLLACACFLDSLAAVSTP